MKKFLLAATILAGTATAAPASASTTLTFEGQANTIYTAPIVRQGFEIGNPAGQTQHFHEIDSTNFGLASNGTGVLLNDRDTEIFLQVAGGGTFTLTQFDIAASLNNQPGNTFTATGFFGGNQVAQVSGNLGQFATVGGFGNTVIDYLLFDGLGGQGGFELDNIVLNGVGNAVPEPGTWAMMLLGFFAVGAALRTSNSGRVQTRVRYS